MTEIAQPPAPTRDRTFDILKGILILAVVLLHSTGRSASKLVEKESTAWWILKAINWSLCFAVPTFIFVSVFLWSRSQMRRDDWSGYFQRRIRSIVVPYLIWTVLYWLFRVWPEHTLTPTTLMSVRTRAIELVAGKAYFHLYFMIVLIQLAIVFPWIYRGTKAFFERLKSTSPWAGFGVLLVITLAVQYAVFAGYRAIFPFLFSHFRFQYPASIVFWYITSLLPGVWLALNWDKWSVIKRPLVILAPIVAALLCVRILSYETELLNPKADVSSYIYNGAIAFFALSMALSLIAGCQAIDRTRIAEPLAYLGRNSMQVYFIHPMVMFLMSGHLGNRIVTAIPGAPIWSFVLLVALSIGVTEAFRRLKLDPILFGRS